MLGALLVGLAIVGPMVAYAGVTAIYPESVNTVNVDTTPPVTLARGTDMSQAENIGFANSFTSTNNGASYTLTLSGLSGGNVTVDKLLFANKTAAVSTYKFQISTAWSGTLNPDDVKFRLWTGGTAPTTDNSAGLCAVLNLEAALDTETTGTCSDAAVFVQLVLTLPTGVSSETATVSVRPSSIVFA